MANIFKCIGNEVESVPDSILEDLGLSYKELNRYNSNIAILSKTLKKNKGITFCRLPFCHTVEAEAFGSTVVFDHKYGNRIGEYAIKDINSIKDLKEFDLSKGRIAEVLKATMILKADGENVFLEITGPFTIGTSIIRSELFFKSIRKDKEKVIELLELIEDNVVDFILEGVNSGVDIISFTDPAGTLDIVGPKIYKDLSGKSTYNILKRVEDKLGDSIVHLCGKTSTSLESIGLLETEKVKTEGQDYFEMIKNIKNERKDIKFLGHWCLKTEAKTNELTICKLI
ncbi:uroporphyrinogen decarboxylase [Schnuerera sp. xch1]|uniref:uroporphyrinogen decarboxylase family protein n=1 Tax=Schnuerera sp. xch1 TaxID=2874283 RepID=UPI001CBCC593|nr:uroporphyrinogen decarboxylase family protein [Schnuerera sp. xch1]MBZ2174710.1 uroporphyrinogen decarboxylase [Schnuerera sp. xch1]